MNTSDRLVAALAMAIAAFASMTLVGSADPARAGPRRMDSADCEDGDCQTGTLPTEGVSRVEDIGDDESPSESEGPGSVGDDTEAPEPDTNSETSSGATASDRRLKRDIRLLTTLDSGIRLYAFRYLWGTEVHVGVMAQDLVADPRYADAAIMTPSGTYVVDYARLGLRMATLEEWNADGLDAVTLQGMPGGQLAAVATATH